MNCSAPEQESDCGLRDEGGGGAGGSTAVGSEIGPWRL